MIEISISTRGIDAQQDALSQLTAKFGRPASIKPEVLQNRMGARFDTFTASWGFGPLGVSFIGASGSLDSGIILASTPQSRRFREELFEAQKSLSREPAL